MSQSSDELAGFSQNVFAVDREKKVCAGSAGCTRFRTC